MKKQKSEFEAKFNNGQSTGKKLELHHTGPNGDRSFAATEFLSARQNFILLFSLGCYKARHKEAQLTKQDAHGVEEADKCFRLFMSLTLLWLISTTFVPW